MPVYGWNTKKTETGFVWSVTCFIYGTGTTTLRSGTCSTRERATRQAKRNVMVYRRGQR